MRFPLENFPTIENRIAFWLLHKVAWISKDWNNKSGWKSEVFESIQQAYANQIGNARRVWSTVVKHLQDEQSNRSPILITGHSHVPGVVAVPNTEHTYINTGSWTFDSHTVLHLNRQTQQIRLFDWVEQEDINDEAYHHLQYKNPWDKTLIQGDFIQWWDQNYLGWFRFNGIQATYDDTNK
jgi:hypothetical protein